LAEIRRLGAQTSDRILNSVFFGGGTPSLMAPDTVALILESVRSTWCISNDFEVTLEANPTSVDAGHFRGYRDAGVNRVSVGIQALNDVDLKALGRLHSVAEACAAFDLARRTFDRVSLDLIYARQNQNLEDWRSELAKAIEMAADHLSLYQLTIEGGTAFGDRFARGKLPGLPNEDLSADMYMATQEICDAAGLPAYEISNHAAPGAESRHNLIYWQGGDYAGIGPGAHGRLTLDGVRMATETPPSPAAWLFQTETTGSGEMPRTPLSRLDQANEYLMMGLRLNSGVSLSRLANFGIIIKSNIKYLRSLSLVDTDSDNLFVTPKGRPILNAVLRELLVDPA